MPPGMHRCFITPPAAENRPLKPKAPCSATVTCLVTHESRNIGGCKAQGYLTPHDQPDNRARWGHSGRLATSSTKLLVVQVLSWGTATEYDKGLSIGLGLLSASFSSNGKCAIVKRALHNTEVTVPWSGTEFSLLYDSRSWPDPEVFHCLPWRIATKLRRLQEYQRIRAVSRPQSLCPGQSRLDLCTRCPWAG